MKSVLLRCRDADMMGPICDYITEMELFSEAVREMRVHAETHNEWGVTDDDVTELERLFVEKSAE